MGTELGLPTFRIEGGGDNLIPSWVREGRPGLNVAGDVEIASCDDGPDIGDTSSDAGAAVRPQPECQRPTDTEFMPNAATIAGMQHLTDNLNADVNKAPPPTGA
eukprot:3915824-Pyramimonas_sp.AAC.1